jgi:hypothetical protein
MAAAENTSTHGPVNFRRRWTSGFIAVLLLAQLLLPLRYYLSETEDERFAWRMFSSVRMRRCDATLYETIRPEGRLVERAVPREALVDWQDLLEQQSPDVVAKVMRWCLGRPGVVSTRLVIHCRTPGGRDLPAKEWRLEAGDKPVPAGGRRAP